MTGSSSQDKDKGKGCPFADGGSDPTERSPLTYNNYLKVEELKNLQICMSDPAHHDEPLFIVIHQTYELWFKLILHELDEVVVLLNKKEIRQAIFFLKRVVSILKLLVQQIHILETMAPYDFLGFREHLNPASGFQSGQFREIEFALGIKDAKILEHFAADPYIYTALTERFNKPSLNDLFLKIVKELGPKPDKKDNPQDEHFSVLVKLYSNRFEYCDIYDLAEVLVDIDESLYYWRSNHVTVVERTIGFKKGTGGSEGVGYLQSTLSKRAFPKLWQCRTGLQQ